jgi:hypothetical protein
VSPCRAASAACFLWSAQKFFRARHAGQPLPRNGCCATITQCFIFLTSSASLISFRAFTLRKSSARAHEPNCGQWRQCSLIRKNLAHEAPHFAHLVLAFEVDERCVIVDERPGRYARGGVPDKYHGQASRYQGSCECSASRQAMASEARA